MHLIAPVPDIPRSRLRADSLAHNCARSRHYKIDRYDIVNPDIFDPSRCIPRTLRHRCRVRQHGSGERRIGISSEKWTTGTLRVRILQERRGKGVPKQREEREGANDVCKRHKIFQKRKRGQRHEGRALLYFAQSATYDNDALLHDSSSVWNHGCSDYHDA